MCNKQPISHHFNHLVDKLWENWTITKEKNAMTIIWVWFLASSDIPWHGKQQSCYCIRALHLHDVRSQHLSACRLCNIISFHLQFGWPYNQLTHKSYVMRCLRFEFSVSQTCTDHACDHVICAHNGKIRAFTYTRLFSQIYKIKTELKRVCQMDEWTMRKFYGMLWIRWFFVGFIYLLLCALNSIQLTAYKYV